MKSIFIILIANILFCFASLSIADEKLMLFGVDLKDAPKHTLVVAIEKHGCTPVGEKSMNLSSFNVSKLKFFNFTNLDAVFDENGKFVMASYRGQDSFFKLYGDDLDRLETMLKAKYGKPSSDSLADSFHSKAIWNMGNGMELILDNDSFSGTKLKYVDTNALSKFEALVKDVQKRSAIKAGKEKAGIF